MEKANPSPQTGRTDEVEDLQMNRRSFSRLLLGSAALKCVDGTQGVENRYKRNKQESGHRFRVAVIADTHIVDPYYKGPEDTPEDTQSMAFTTERLIAARKEINHIAPAVEQIFHLGDVVHDSPAMSFDFYSKNRTRLDIARDLFAGFHAPLHMTLGNHDYVLSQMTREQTHQLFAEKLKIQPYKAIEYKGWKFILLNCFMGATWDNHDARYDEGTGTLGRAQLEWLDAELAQPGPSIVMTHYPLWRIDDEEFMDLSLQKLLRKYHSKVQLVLAGHWHKWVDFAHTFGPQHYLVASTRYDPNAMMILDLEENSSRWQIANTKCIDWSTHHARAF
jgi:3',5'-cyclic AMP phosphodiesterase CpdA